MITIRRSLREDIPQMQRIFAEAKEKMRADGNLFQWTGDYPSDEILLNDIERQFSYIVECDGEVVATFVLAECEEPTYKHIYEGKWLDDVPDYATIHRIASLRVVHGMMRVVLDFAFSQIKNIRIDTHRDNHIMRHLLEANGFVYCGIIYLKSGDERLAYQKII